MKLSKYLLALLMAFSMSFTAQAAVYSVVDSDLLDDGEIYKYLSTSLDNVFEDSSGFVAAAALFDQLTNDPEDALAIFNTETGSSFDFTGFKYDDGTGDYPTLTWLDNTYGQLDGEVTLSAIILKASTYSLIAVFSTPIDTLEWNSLWTPKGGNANSHYVLYPDVSEVPLPAAAFLFAPALLGFMAIRRKSKA